MSFSRSAQEGGTVLQLVDLLENVFLTVDSGRGSNSAAARLAETCVQEVLEALKAQAGAHSSAVLHYLLRFAMLFQRDPYDSAVR